MNKTKRNSKIELLRIISMFFIILSHYTSLGGINTEALDLSFNKFIIQFSQLGGLGADIFIMISGFFCINSKFNLKQIIKTITEVWFYSVVIYFIYHLISGSDLNIIELIRTLFPVIFTKYWFVSAYIILYLLSPFINELLNSLTRKQFLNLLFVVLIIWSVIPTFTFQQMFANGFINLFTMYVIGAYFGKIPQSMLSRKNSAILVVLSTALAGLSIIITDILSVYTDNLSAIPNHIFERNSIIIVSLAIGIFCLFCNSNKSYSNIINKISSSAFAVYLIHTHPSITDFIWVKVLKCNEFAHSPYLIFYMLGTVIAVFAACLLIDLLRQLLFKFTIDKCIDKISTFANRKLQSLSKRVYSLTKAEK